MIRKLVVFLVWWLACSCAFAVVQRTSLMIEEFRGRRIPVEIYRSDKTEDLPVVVINHGYGLVKNTDYSFLANPLANLGYTVVSIQHDLPSDLPLPRSGSLFEKRKPWWERGVQNIDFVLNELRKETPSLRLDRIVLIGHSNGGDIAMMFADQCPDRVAKIVSFDSLRYPFPTSGLIPILHFAATDTTADRGVVPIQGVETVVIDGVKHKDFSDQGPPSVRVAVLQAMIPFLRR
jgi:predicted esterase